MIDDVFSIYLDFFSKHPIVLKLFISSTSVFIFMLTLRCFMRCFDLPSTTMFTGVRKRPLKFRVADFFCNWRWGFNLMYRLGWAEEGVHFIVCDQDDHSV